LYYNPLNPTGCNKNDTFTSEFHEGDGELQSSIYMVERGDCTFVTKTRNIAQAGGMMALVIDNTNENITNVIMSDDGTGAGIRIPSVLIGSKDGEILKNFMRTAAQD